MGYKCSSTRRDYWALSLSPSASPIVPYNSSVSVCVCRSVCVCLTHTHTHTLQSQLKCALPSLYPFHICLLFSHRRMAQEKKEGSSWIGAHWDHRWSMAFFLQEIWETPLSPIKTQCVRLQWCRLWAPPLQLALFLKLEVFRTKTWPS